MVVYYIIMKNYENMEMHKLVFNIYKSLKCKLIMSNILDN